MNNCLVVRKLISKKIRPVSGALLILDAYAMSSGRIPKLLFHLSCNKNSLGILLPGAHLLQMVLSQG